MVNQIALSNKRSIIIAPLLCVVLFLSLAMPSQSRAQSGESLAVLSDHMPPETKVNMFVQNMTSQNTSVHGSDDLVAYQWKRSQPGQFDEFVRVNVKKIGENPWSANFKSASNDVAIKKGEWVYAGYYVRATPGTAQASTRGFIERGGNDWMMISDASVATGTQWTRVVAVGKAEQDFAVGELHLSLHLAHAVQSIDIADLIFLSVDGSVSKDKFPATQLVYEGMDEAAPWRVQAKKMIEQYRHDEFSIFVLNRDGSPAPETSIQVELEDIDFDLGSMAHGLLVEDSDLGKQYRRWFKQFFNYATATIYWADWGWENPEVRDEYLTKMAYFRQEGIEMRGHVLLYPAFRFSPQVLNSLEDDRDAFIARVNQHIDEMVPILREHGMNEYDVINELRAEKEWLDIVGIDTVVDWYKRVHALHPEAVLYINENSILTEGGENTAQKDHYYTLIESLLKKGAPIHGIGMQGHFNGIVTPPEKMWEILDRFAAFDLPIRITEYDTDTRDEEGQGAYDTDFYEAMYAHPNVLGVTRWGFYEPVMWRPSGALIDANNDLKKNASKYLDWLSEKRNFDTQLSTNTKGMATFNGKYGRYSVNIGEQSYSCLFSQTIYLSGRQKSSQVPSCTIRLQ
ncbi:endo-1,4-beta-xylanase [Ningiella sp. W23]|uniref:endo-1,4-beta-xylanase n=1 Tax=Ningiella sp. W23 TaxID=3023715 RepID=UPI0037576C2A